MYLFWGIGDKVEREHWRLSTLVVFCSIAALAVYGGMGVVRDEGVLAAPELDVAALADVLPEWAGLQFRRQFREGAAPRCQKRKAGNGLFEVCAKHGMLLI